MFKNVLIAEDHEIASISLRKTMEDLGINNIDYVYYCDYALAWINRGMKDGQPYDLLITDLSFEADGKHQELADGQALIAAARKVQPDLKVLVFSAESRPALIEKLFSDSFINGYVRKARNDAQELKLAIENLFKNKVHFPPLLRQATKQNAHNFTNFDTTIIGLLAKGMLQKDIPEYLQQHDIKPAGLSSLEKRLNLIREAYSFTNNEQLVVYCKVNKII